MTVRSDIDELISLAQAAPADVTEIVGAEGERFRIEWLNAPAGSFRLTEQTHRRTSCPRTVTWIPPTADPPSVYHRDLPYASELVTTMVEQGDFTWVQWSLPDVDPAEVAAAAMTVVLGAPGDDGRRQRVQAFRDMQPDDTTKRRLDERLVALIDSASRSGWSVERDESTEHPFSTRKVVLARDGQLRELVRGGVFGLPTITLR
jgi:hypothetical protein